MPFNVSMLAVKKYIDENYDVTLILAQGLPEEYAYYQKQLNMLNVYPISYNELIDLQVQAKDLADYAQKVSKQEAALLKCNTTEPTDINKQTIPETLQETACNRTTGGIGRIDRI